MAKQPTGPWWKSIMAGFDIESTGVDIYNDRVVTASFVTLVPGGGGPWDTEVKEWLINPGVEIPEGATKVHGVSTEYARNNGVSPERALNEVSDQIYRCLSARIPILGMNLAYDLSLLYYDCMRNGVVPPDKMVDFFGPFVDAMVLDRYLDPYRKGKRTLEALCRQYGVRIDGAHDATFDALAAARIVYRQAYLNPAIGFMDLHKLHDQQVVWRAQQSASLQAYFRRSNPKAVVDPCWPVCYGH